MVNKMYIKGIVNSILMVSVISGVSVTAEARSQHGPPQGTSAGEKQVISLTLEQAISRAMQANRTVLSSRYGMDNQKISLSSAWADFDWKIFPAASAGLSGTDSDSAHELGIGLSFEKRLQRGTRIFVNPDTSWIDDTYNTRVEISFDQPLLRGFGKDVNLNSVRSSEFSVRTSERNVYLTKVNIVLETVSAVYEVIKQRELLSLNEHLAERLKGHAISAKAKEKVGLSTPMDTFRAEIRLKDAQDSITLSAESLENALDRLKIILALPVDTDLYISAPVERAAFTMNVEHAVNTALRNRVELIQINDELKESERRSEIAKRNILPELRLAVNYARFGVEESFGRSASFDEYLWGVRLVSGTDLARIAEKAAYQQSLIETENLRLSMQNERDEIQKQVRQQMIALEKSQERIDIRDEQIRQAEGKLALAKVKFKHGMSDNFDVIEAETELQRARVDVLSVETDYIVGLYTMRAILGTLIER